MKKVYLIFAIFVAIVITSCKEKTPKDADTKTRTEKSSEETTSEITSSEKGVPSFEDADIQAYIKRYESYSEDYKQAFENESSDVRVFSELATRGYTLANNYGEIIGKISTADAEKLEVYMIKKTDELEKYQQK